MPETDLMALLTGAEPPPDAPAGLRSAAEVLAALRAYPAGDELAGEQAALSQFRQQAGVSSLERRSRRRRPAMFVAALAATAAVTLAVIALSLDAYHDGLPGPFQRLAHDAIGAPTAGPEQSVGASPIASGTPGRPRGDGPSAGRHQPTGVLSQLCASYEGMHGHGGGVGRSTAFHELIRAAGGAGKVPAFCARLSHPGAPPSSPPRPPHKNKPHPNPNGNSNPQGNGGGGSQGNGNSGGNGSGKPPGIGNANGNSQGNGNGNGNAQGAGVPAAYWADTLAT